MDEQQIRHDFLRPIHAAILEIHDKGVILGNLNPDTIFYDEATRHFTIGECISSFCGYEQHPLYETITRDTTTAEAKGNRDFSADFFALGTLSIFLGTGKDPMSHVDEEHWTHERLTHGTQECYLSHLVKSKHPLISAPMQQLFRGVLTDIDEERWQLDEFDAWIRRRETNVLSPSRLHKEASISFVFDDKEYFSRRALSFAISNNWNKARSTIKVEELMRWVKMSLKKAQIADRIDALDADKENVIADEKLAKILHLIDPAGPICYQKHRINILGIGQFLANAYVEDKRDNIQAVANIFTLGLVENWINVQENTEDYSFSSLLWTPFKINQYLKKTSIGFGIERVLYSLNPRLPCQSKVLGGLYVITLDDLLFALDEMAPQKQKEIDPIDRHSAAFIAERIELQDEIRVKGIQGVPGMHNNAHIMMLALLTVAQGRSGHKVLKGISGWIKTRFSDVLEVFYNARIKKSFAAALEKSAKSGVLTDLYRTVRDPSYIKRDQKGFREAKAQFRALNHEVMMLSAQKSIEKVAYQYGLRLCVMFSYIILVITILLIVVRAA